MSNDLFRVAVHHNNTLPIAIYVEHDSIKLSLNDAEQLYELLPTIIEEHKEYLVSNNRKAYELEQQIAELTLQLNNLRVSSNGNIPPQHQKKNSYGEYNGKSKMV